MRSLRAIAVIVLGLVLGIAVRSVEAWVARGIVPGGRVRTGVRSGRHVVVASLEDLENSLLTPGKVSIKGIQARHEIN